MKHQVLTITLACLLIIAGAFIGLYIYERHKEITRLKKEASYMIQQVEAYRQKHHKLPQYEADLQLDLPDDYPVSYAIT